VLLNEREKNIKLTKLKNNKIRIIKSDYQLITQDFRKKIAQPIGGDYGLSRRLVKEFLKKKILWEDENFKKFG